MNEQDKQLLLVDKPCGTQYYDNWHSIDWLNAYHFDYRGLISKGLAIEAPEGMYGKK